MIKQNKTWIGRLFLCCLLTACAALFVIHSAGAQDNRADYLRLTADQSVYDLAPFTDVTRDPQKALNFQVVYQRYRNAQYGKRFDNEIMPLGTQNVPHWMVFEAQNLTPISDWVLSFGDRLQGRTGLVKEILVYEHNSRTRYIDNLARSSSKHTKKTLDKAIAVTIPPGKKSLFFVYLVPEPGLPVTLAPQLLTAEAYYGALASPFSFSTTAIFIIALAIGILFALLLLHQYRRGLLFAACLLTQGAFLLYLNDTLYSSFPLAGTVSGWLFGLAAIFALVASKQFLELDASQKLAASLPFILGIFIVAGGLAALLNLPPNLQTAALYVPPISAYLGLFMLAVAQNYVGKPMALRLGLAWLALFFGALISGMTLYGTLPPIGVLAKTYWYAAGLQAMLLIAAAVGQVAFAEDRQHEAKNRDAEEEEILEQLQQSKEAIENQRLKRMIEHERAAMNELRDREIQQKEEMRRAKEVADEANRAKSAFLAVVSHEIRTPMTGVMGMVRLLLDTSLSKKQMEYAQTIQDSGDAMLALLNDILDFEKIESGKLDLELVDFDLKRLIQGISTLMSGHAAAKNIYLKIEMSPDLPDFAVGDPVRLRQVLLNLIGNSIKFTETGGITLSVKVDSTANARGRYFPIRFSVIDTGVGISREAQSKLFNPFSQADSSVTRKFGGTGLGLAISQRLIETMGGKIRIDSTEGEGSTFFFTVTLEEGSAEAAIEHSDQRSSKGETGKAQRILIVEDNEINRKLLKEFVKRMGHQIKLATTGEEALELIDRFTFDLVLMDMELPGLSGMGTTKAIRALADKNKATLPVLALTGNTRDEDIRKCFAANMNGHIAKPVDPKKLSSKINNIAEGKLDNPIRIDDKEIDLLTIKRPSDPLPTDAPGNPEKEAPTFEWKPETASRESLDSSVHGADEESTAAASLPAPSAETDVLTTPPLSKEEDNRWQTAPIHEYAHNNAGLTIDDDFEEDSFQVALQAADKDPALTDSGLKVETEVFAPETLQSLKKSMESEQFQEMIDSFLDKADEIVSALTSAQPEQEIEQITARAHELKGMAANFGLIEVSEIAGLAEKFARQGEISDIRPVLDRLSAASERGKEAICQWAES